LLYKTSDLLSLVPRSPAKKQARGPFPPPAKPKRNLEREFLVIEPTFDNNNRNQEQVGVLVHALPVCAANDSAKAMNTRFKAPRPLSPEETARRDAKVGQMRTHEKVKQQQRQKLEEAAQRKKEMCANPDVELSDEEYYNVLY